MSGNIVGEVLLDNLECIVLSVGNRWKLLQAIGIMSSCLGERSQASLMNYGDICAGSSTHCLFHDIGRDHDNSDKRKLSVDFVNQRK